MSKPSDDSYKMGCPTCIYPEEAVCRFYMSGGVHGSENGGFTG